MSNLKTGFIQLTTDNMKAIKGGALPPKTRWSCLVDGFYYNVCYSVQPQTPCSYSTACTENGVCYTPDACIH